MTSISVCSALCLLFSIMVKAQDPEDGPVPNASPVPTMASSPNSQAGASGGNQGAYSLSRGGLIAIIVVVVVFAVLGVGSAILFYVAKKRQWELRKSIRRASKRIVSRRNSATSLNRQSHRHGTVRLNSPPQSSKPRDVEKGEVKRVAELQNTTEAEKAPRSMTNNAAKDKKWKAILPESWSVGNNRASAQAGR